MSSSVAEHVRTVRPGFAWLAALPAVIVMVNGVGLGQVGTTEHRGLSGEYARQVFADPMLLGQLGNSLIVGLGAVALTCLAGVPIVVFLRRRSDAGRSMATMDGVLTLPIALPGIVVGFFTIVMIGRVGLVSHLLPQVAGSAYSLIGLVVAYFYFSIPRVVGPLRGVADVLDFEPQNVAVTLGASRMRAFMSTTLPQLLPALVETAGTAAAVAIGGYGTAATLAQQVRLLPVSAVSELTMNYAVASASGIIIVLTAVVVVILVVTRLAVRTLKRRLS